MTKRSRVTIDEKSLALLMVAGESLLCSVLASQRLGEPVSMPDEVIADLVQALRAAWAVLGLPDPDVAGYVSSVVPSKVGRA